MLDDIAANPGGSLLESTRAMCASHAKAIDMRLRADHKYLRSIRFVFAPKQEFMRMLDEANEPDDGERPNI